MSGNEVQVHPDCTYWMHFHRRHGYYDYSDYKYQFFSKEELSEMSRLGLKTVNEVQEDSSSPNVSKHPECACRLLEYTSGNNLIYPKPLTASSMLNKQIRDRKCCHWSHCPNISRDCTMKHFRLQPKEIEKLREFGLLDSRAVPDLCCHSKTCIGLLNKEMMEWKWRDHFHNAYDKTDQRILTILKIYLCFTLAFELRHEHVEEVFKKTLRHLLVS